jgi:hypothetical protein
MTSDLFLVSCSLLVGVIAGLILADLINWTLDKGDRNDLD